MIEMPKRDISPADDKRERMQRIRVGLTGLAVVLLIVVLATALFRRVDNQVLPSDNINSVAPPKIIPNEPLAELGVAPGAATINSAEAKAK